MADDEPVIISDGESIVACYLKPRAFCGAAGQNSTFIHQACLDGGNYTYVLNWGDAMNTDNDKTVAGILLDDGQTAESTHIYAAEGTFEANFQVGIFFPPDFSTSIETTYVWEIGSESCSQSGVETPTTAPSVSSPVLMPSAPSPTPGGAPSFAPSSTPPSPTSGGLSSLNGIRSPLTLAAVTCMLLMKMKFFPFQ